MIRNYLNRAWNYNKLHNSYLITVDNLEVAMAEIVEFINEAFYPEKNVFTHPDFMLIKKTPDNVNNITVQQIRDLKNFLNKTPILSNYKSVIIYNAEKMNLNAANSCLKLLEDSSNNTYIFLIVVDITVVIPTILSRCMKLNCNYNYSKKNNLLIKQVDDYYIKPFLKKTTIDEHLSYLNDITLRGRELWFELTNNAQNLILKFCKQHSSCYLALSFLEDELLEQLTPISIDLLVNRYDKLTKLTDDTISFGLELKASYLLLISILR